jgi:hypothetical protein
MSRPTENGHWYTKTGEPCYTIIGKNGKERPTTIRDARKLNLVPSVTTVMGLVAKPGLENWKQEQTILACLTLPKIEGESEAEYISRIKADAKEQSIKAAERGTRIHAYVQTWFEGNEVEQDSDGYEFMKSAHDTIFNALGHQDWICEKSFASLGYGGKADLHNELWLIDIKTTEKDLENIKTWDEHAMQLAAYDKGLGGYERSCAILYINANTAESKLIEIPKVEIDKGWKCFRHLLHYWYDKNEL